MATPPSPRSKPEQVTSSSSSYQQNTNGNRFSNSKLSGPSPSPSPALSAYSYTSSTSSDSDFDLNSLSLDDWGTSSRNRSIVQSESDKSIKGYLASQYNQSGTSTPVPGARSSTSHFENYLREKQQSHSSSSSSNGGFSSSAENVTSHDTTDLDELENEPDGFDVEDEDEEDMHANGVPAARGFYLDARKSQTDTFQQQVLTLFSERLKLDTWSEETVNDQLLPLEAKRVQLKRISGAFSNAVFFVSYDKQGFKGFGPKTVLLRVYGKGTEVLLSRRAELLILHTLSSLYGIGPNILGTFANGRVEMYFDAEPIGKDGIRDLGNRREQIMEDGSLLVRGSEGRAQWVARRMRQLHEVPLETMKTVLEQGDLRSNGDSTSLFGRGIENHLFARSHRPRIQRNSTSANSIQNNQIDPSRQMRESPAPMTEEQNHESSLTAVANEGAQAKAMSIRGFTPHRNSSVASFDSLATSYNSQDSMSNASMSNENLLGSPTIGVSGSTASSYTESVNAVRYPKGSSTSNAATRSPYIPNHRSSLSLRSSNGSSQPYPGMWRRSKRWAREAGKVLALVDEFCKTSAGQDACKNALKGTPLEGEEFSPFTSYKGVCIPSLELGTTVASLQLTLLAIASLNFPRFLAEMDAFKTFVRKWERMNGASRRVLAHGDTQYSNLLLIKEGALEEEQAGKGMPRERSRDSSISSSNNNEDSKSRSNSISSETQPHQSQPRSRSRRVAPYERLVVIDFEYCSPNPRAYDIANAFHEWRFDYHHLTDCWSPYTFNYPTRDERRRWLRAYVEQGRLLRMRGKAPKAALDSPRVEASPTDQIVTPPATSVLPTPTEDLELPPCVISNTDSGTIKATSTIPKSVSRPPLSNNSSISSPGLSALAGMPSPSFNATLSGVESSPRVYARSQATLANLEHSMQREIDRLELEVEIFSPACHASWALWGMSFAKESIENLLRACLNEGYLDPAKHGQDHGGKDGLIAGSAESFDNLRYTLSRVELFRAELKSLGIVVDI